MSTFTLLPDQPAVYWEWLRLVLAHDAKGKVAHDARLVAAMQVHGLSELLTFNTVDFVRYAGSGVRILDPTAIVAIP